MLSLTIALAFTGLCAAQSTTSLLIPDADPQPLIASIVGSVRTLGSPIQDAIAHSRRTQQQLPTPYNASLGPTAITAASLAC